MPELQSSSGSIRYRDSGGPGATVVLVHGVLVDSTVWDPLIADLTDRFRCIAPDLPLGSHRVAMDPQADLSPTGVAALVAELLERLNLQNVTLVGNDTGGALPAGLCPSP